MKIRPIERVKAGDHDAVLLVGGQSPMLTFIGDERLHRLVAGFWQAGRLVAVVCHATCALPKVKLPDGRLLVQGRTSTGFANSEEQFAVRDGRLITGQQQYPGRPRAGWSRSR